MNNTHLCAHHYRGRTRLSYQTPMGVATEIRLHQEERQDTAFFVDGTCVQVGPLDMDQCTLVARRIRELAGEQP